MKTIILYTVLTSLFCTCTCVFGKWQPRQLASDKNVVSESYVKICEEVHTNFTTGVYVDPDAVLCFGLNFLSKQLRNTKTSQVIENIDKISNPGFCKNFKEMRLNTALENANKSVAVYNLQFRDKNGCQRACLDLMENINPLCKIILLLSRHLKGNSKESAGDNAPLDTSSTGNVGSHANKPSAVKPPSDKGEHPAAVPEEHHNNIADEEKPNTSAVKQLSTVHDTGNSALKDTHDNGNAQSIGGEAGSQGQAQPAAGTEHSSDTVKQKIIDQRVKLTTLGDTDTSATQKGKDASTPQTDENEKIEQKEIVIDNNNTMNNDSKKIVESVKEQMETTVEDSNLVTKNENTRKSDSSTVNAKQEPEHTSALVPKGVGGNGSEETTVTAHEKISDAVDSTLSQVVDADSDSQNSDSILKVAKANGGQEISNAEKLQVDMKDTKNHSLKHDVKPSGSSKPTPESNIAEQGINQHDKNEYTDETTAPQSGRSDPQKMASKEIHFTDDTGAGAAVHNTHFSVEAGESNDNTEFTSGGGTGVDYARPGSDVLESDKNEADVETVLIDEKFDTDDSHFFAYFMTTMVFCIVGYLLFHNKQKILALALEGRAKRGRRRPNTSGYRKLDSNLEEAISSSKSASVTQVIY